MAEMINSSDLYTESPDHTQNNRFLFSGTSCFPLSPCDEMKSQLSNGQASGASTNVVSQNDQMIKILEVLGYQDPGQDLSFVIDEGVLKYQNKIQGSF